MASNAENVLTKEFFWPLYHIPTTLLSIQVIMASDGLDFSDFIRGHDQALGKISKVWFKEFCPAKNIMQPLNLQLHVLYI